MPLPASFHFSQNNLQDYVDCPRRFELRHLLRLEWPALQSEPVLEHERQMELGQRFHQLAQQYFTGLSADLLAAQAASDPDLERWWEAFLRSGILEELPAQRYPERQLSAPFAGFRLLAQYDLLAIQPGQKAIIMDWKTGIQSGKPNPARLKSRLQTRLYPFLLALAGSHLNGGQPIHPERIEMGYWFSEHPTKPLHLAYSAAQMEEDEHLLRRLIAEIQALASPPAGKDLVGRFLLTPDERKCTFCNYRSLCQRGAKAGNLQELPEDLEPAEDESYSLDFENIEPIAF